MVGALNKLPIAASGIMFFGDPATFANVTAIFIGKAQFFLKGKISCVDRVSFILLAGFVAGLVYSYAKTIGSRPSNQSQSIPMSASSQSAADAAKANGKM